MKNTHQTTIQLMISLTVDHNEQEVSAEELASAAAVKLEVVLHSNPFLDTHTSPHIGWIAISDSKVNLIDVIPTNYPRAE